MDKIVISATELSQVAADQVEAPRVEPKLPPAIAWWTRALLALLVPFLPLLCFVTIILRTAFRGQPSRTRHAWTAYLSTLLIVSGFLTSMALVFALFLGPVGPSFVSTGLSELDERTDYPALPAKDALNGVDASHELKSLVAVISPASHSLFGKREMLSASFGAGMLLHASSSGYLFATARHVIGTDNWDLGKGPRAMISLASGIWSGADVIAKHKTLDLALIWLPRHSGDTNFVQPVADPTEGENIYVIGHPEGLKFTLSTGLVSRIDGTTLQITAPISPGNSGGPVYDSKGNLIGIVSYTMDKSIQPNAEDLNFAVAAGALLREAGWDFAKDGRDRFLTFVHASQQSAPNRQSKLLFPALPNFLPALRTDAHY